MSEHEGGKRQKYKERRTLRLAGRPAQMRERMPWWYESAMADFALREKEQAEAAKRGPLSSDPLQPWGNPRVKRFREEIEEGRGRSQRNT